jgi:uncharacterized protein YndB with AHSA1/START domain
MLKVIAGIVVVVAVMLSAGLVYVAFKPDTFRVERTLDIQAPPERVFALINDFHRWGSWSPYETKDPAMKRTMSGPASGTGAVYEWEGDTGKVGSGRMEIINASPSRITIKLDFLKPFEGHNVADFTLEPKGDLTKVTWAMQGPSSLVHKVMGLFMNLDRMIGDDFQTGLANLKSLAEAPRSAGRS